MLPGREVKAALSRQGPSSPFFPSRGSNQAKKARSPPVLAEAAAAPATARPSLDGDRVPPKPGKVPSILTARPAGMLQDCGEGPQPLFTDRLHSRLQSSSGYVRKNPSGKARVRVGTFSPGTQPPAGRLQHPQSDAILLPQQSALLYYRFSKVTPLKQLFL